MKPGPTELLQHLLSCKQVRTVTDVSLLEVHATTRREKAYKEDVCLI